MTHIQKILFIIDHLKGGGAERISVEVASHLSLEYQVSIALMDANNIRMPIPTSVKQINLDIHPEFMSGSLWKRKNRRLKSDELIRLQSLIATEKPDLIILSYWYTVFLLPYLPDNTWFWIHNAIFTPEKKKTNNLFRWYKETRNHYHKHKNFPKLLNGKNLILVNEDLQNTFQQYLPKSKLKVIHNGIDLKKFTINDLELNKKWDCIFLGRLSPEKQPEVALQAFAQSELSGNMVVIGDGELLPQLKILAKQLNIEARVDFLGWQDDVQYYLTQSRILVLSSQTEASGLVIAEAMALNVPVVAFNCSEGVAFQFYSEDSKRGLVPSQNFEQFIKQLNDVYHNPYEISLEHKAHLSIQRSIQEFKKLLPDQ